MITKWQKWKTVEQDVHDKCAKGSNFHAGPSTGNSCPRLSSNIVFAPKFVRFAVQSVLPPSAPSTGARLWRSGGWKKCVSTRT
eukprot:1814249-Amphidinium_carterae.1